MNRIGFGFDSHRFEKGKPLMLGGVEVPHDRGLAGHSDGDAALHALIDALFGAAGLADIGEHFPNTDPQWKGIASSELVTEAFAELTEMGWTGVNCDLAEGMGLVGAGEGVAVFTVVLLEEAEG